MPADRSHRGLVALACTLMFSTGFLPANAAYFDENARALALLNGRSCSPPVRVAQTDRGGVAGSPAPAPTPSFPPIPAGPIQLIATPVPTSTPATPPLSSATTSSAGTPVFLVRGGVTPPPITPAGEVPPSPMPIPTGAATLAPGDVAVLADRVTGNTQNNGTPADAYGNVHIFYSDEELVGDHAHYDGQRTITVTGHPFIINHARDSILNADEVVFDTIDQTAKLTNGRGESAQGVERGLVHFSAADLHTDSSGVGHGTDASASTCERPRSGYHVTGKTIDVYPGDRIVISRAILWLGAAAILFLPRVVIPLRQLDESRRTSFFPEVGYNQYEGAYIKIRYGFGRDQYYYGYYRVNYFSKVGLGLGYVGFFQRKDGRRIASIDYYGIHDRRVGVTSHNLTAQDQENFSRTLRGTFNLQYQGNYGPLTNFPPNTSFSAALVHSGLHSSQNLTFNRSSVGSQSNTSSFAFTDQRQITTALSNAVNFSLSRSSSNFGGVSQSNSTAHFTTLTHLTTHGADYQLTFDKTFATTPFGVNKEPELSIRPYAFFSHFRIPLQAQFAIGQYSEPSTPIHTSRADLAFVIGPALYRIFNSDFSATVNVRQDAYGTGDLKAQIQQVMSLNTPIGHHIVNSISYNEANYNGPPFVPFQFLDLQPTQNTKFAQDLLRLFNGDFYTLSLGFQTNFNAMAQPVTYQFTARPSPRSVVLLGGFFSPGPGQGFGTTNVQFSTPFGRDATLQFVGDVDWKNRARIENKNIYYSKIIGDCYELRLQYNQASKSINMTIDLLAFPSRAASFGISANGPIIPTSFNQF